MTNVKIDPKFYHSKSIYPPGEGALLGDDFRGENIEPDSSRAHFQNINGTRRKFVGIDFSAAFFERAYFYSAIFENCNFTGARFNECNFRNARFNNCIFDFAVFDKTIIDQNIILPNAPHDASIKRALMQSLRANACSIADSRAARAYLLEEIEAAKVQHLKAWQAKEYYYKKTYPYFSSQLGALFKYYGWKLDGFFWGHGEKPLQAIIFVALVIFVCSGFHIYLDYPANGLDSVSVLASELVSHLKYYSLSVFGTTDDTLLPKNHYYFLELIIGWVRFIVFGLVVSVLFRLLSHR